jgi:E3 ubiquitin-protein ligase UBR2
MDPVKRCVGQHIEYEPEWETGFNLLIKLQKVTNSMIEWSASDTSILKQAYGLVLENLNDIENSNATSNFKYESKRLFSKDYRIIEYDIMTQDVSIHAPLTRLLAALHKSLFKHSIKYNDFKLIEDEKVRMNALIEPSLRSIAMASQINVGLWRRNGYSLLSQVTIHVKEFFILQLILFLLIRSIFIKM